MTTTATERRISDDALVQCAASSSVFGKTFFPDAFWAPHNALHREFLDPLDALNEDGTPSYRRIVAAAPRGWGKTTKTILGTCARRICFKTTKFVCYITASGELAIARTENLKRRLLGTPAIRECFGSIRSKRVTDMEEEFAKTAYVACLPYYDDPRYIGTRVLPRGSLQRTRGVGFDIYRPDLLVGDDIDDPRVVKNEVLREEIKDWWFADIRNLVDQYANNWQIIYIGTLTHRDCLLAKLLKLSTWHPVRLSVCDENFRTLDPAFKSQEELDALVAEYEEAGMMDIFKREFMNKDMSMDEAAFLREHFQYYSESEQELNHNAQLRSVVLVDPAKTANLKSAHTAIVGASFHRQRSALYWRDVIAAPTFPNEMYEHAIDMAKRLRATVIACEVTGLSEFVSQPFRNAIANCGQYIQFEELHARQGQGEYAGRGRGKIGRAAALIPYYRRGEVYHNRDKCREMEAQLLAYPDCKRWDIIDAAAYVVQFMDAHEVYLRRQQKARNPRAFEEAYARLRKQQEKQRGPVTRHVREPVYV